jgi:hypothetical protein
MSNNTYNSHGFGLNKFDRMLTPIGYRPQTTYTFASTNVSSGSNTTSNTSKRVQPSGWSSNGINYTNNNGTIK